MLDWVKWRYSADFDFLMLVIRYWNEVSIVNIADDRAWRSSAVWRGRPCMLLHSLPIPFQIMAAQQKYQIHSWRIFTNIAVQASSEELIVPYLITILLNFVDLYIIPDFWFCLVAWLKVHKWGRIIHLSMKAKFYETNALLFYAQLKHTLISLPCL